MLIFLGLTSTSKAFPILSVQLWKQTCHIGTGKAANGFKSRLSYSNTDDDI